MQTGAHLFPSFDLLANVLQIFHNDRAAAVSLSLQNDLFGNAVIDVLHVAPFFARDMPQLLFSRLRTIALKARTHSKESIPLRSKRPSSKQLACGGCGQNIFSQINAHCLIGYCWQNIGQIEDEVKKPSFSFANKLCFFRSAEIEKPFVKSADFQRDLDPPSQSKQRQHSIFQRVGSLIKMDGAPIFKKHLLWPSQRFQTGSCFCDRIAAHLSPKLWQRMSQRAVTKVMQANAVSLFFRSGNRSSAIACIREHVLQFAKSFALKFRYVKLDRNCSFHNEEFMPSKYLKAIFRERQFLSALEGWVSLPSMG
ncbi:MAG: hypothetical protein A3E80_04580 [Chlamydiae bacterium RIFCSPHIGHO2_12_FULL_49_9]|nr:MAG: hypothetical protein A3E80_04580 [Chlamydiae bacterium RIFCSPHIGHO2_12_FULL_49_9]